MTHPYTVLGSALRSIPTGVVRVPMRILRDALEDRPGVCVTLEVDEPRGGVRVRGEAFALGAPLRFAALLVPFGVVARPSARLVRLLVTDVSLSTTEEAPGPLAAAIRSGELDVSRVGDLIADMIEVPEAVVRAEGEHIEIDLLRLPGVSAHSGLVELVSGALTVTDVQVDASADALVLRLGALPGRGKPLWAAVQRHVVRPGLRRLLGVAGHDSIQTRGRG